MKEKSTIKIFKASIFVLLMTVLCLAFTMTASAETIGGNCGKDGDNVTWSLDTETGVLTIAGEGEMEDYGEFYENGGAAIFLSPWRSYNVKTAIISDGVTSIGISSFYNGNGNDSALQEVYIADTVKSIGPVAFEECSSLKNIDLPEGLEIIGREAFAGCYSLESIKFPKSLKTIGDSAFQSCYSLKSVFISSGVREIADDAFTDSFIEKFTVDSSNPYFSSDDDGVLYNKDKSVLILYPAGNKNTEYIMPASVSKVGVQAFLYCHFIEKIVFSDNVKEITGAILYCFGLTDLVLPEACSHLGEYAIAGNPSLKTLTIKSMNTQFDELSVCASNMTLKDSYSLDDLRNELHSSDGSNINDIWNKYFDFHKDDDIVYIGTIICHSGSTAEAYAKENGIDYETVHFFGDWVYDWDNLFREHTCTICGYTEKENLEKETDGDVEIVKPTDPDKDFEVDEIEKNSSKYLLIEESFKQNHEGDYSILRSFDITLKNKDGVHVQPDGTVKVKLPNDWKKNGVYKVYRVNDDGTLTDMNAYRQGSHLVFETDHFSIYVIVDESGEQADTDDSGSDTSSNAFSKFLSKLKDLFKIIIEFFKSLGRK